MSRGGEVSVHFYKNKAGTPVANWPGRGRSVGGVSRKEGQIYLGRVVSREGLVFFKRGLGYYRFDPETQSCLPVGPSEIPPYDGPVDGRERPRPVCCPLGGSYFLDRLVSGIGYDAVMAAVGYGNAESLMALLHYYVLEDTADSHAEYWYKCSYASYLYPRANLASQRVSDLLAAIGTPEARREFLLAHVRYVTESTDDAYYVMVDSTGCQNACGVPITRAGRHEGETNVEFRVIVVVQKSTGLPIWYEVVPGNVVDVSTLESVVIKLGLYGCKVVYVLGDAGYHCPANVERLVLAGVEFMARMNPTYDTYKAVLAEHFDEVADGGADNVVRYRGRPVKVVKVACEVGADRETGEARTGWVYLCRDLEGYHSKSRHLLRDGKRTKGMTSAELLAACERFGVFAIVSTVALPPEDVLPEYYARQGIEQFFDFAKGCGKMMPVRNHNMETIAGHMLLSFAATFLHVLIKNRTSVVDTRYVAVPATLRERVGDEDGEVVEVETGSGRTEMVLVQDPIEPVLARFGTRSALACLQLHCAEVFDDQIVPAVPTREVREMLGAFGLFCPVTVMREGDRLVAVLREGERDRCTRVRAFARRPSVSDEDVERKRGASARKRLERLAAEQGARVVDASGGAEGDAPSPEPRPEPAPEGTKAAEVAEAAPPKRRRGRPKGSKNKKTLEREAEIERQKAAGTYVEPPTRRRGRPKGSKNKKTLEREAAASAQPAGALEDVDVPF